MHHPHEGRKTQQHCIHSQDLVTAEGRESASKRCAPTSLCSPPSSRRFPPGTWTELFYGPCSLSEGTQTVSSQTVLGNEPVLRKQKLLRGVLACSCQSVVCWLLFTMAAALPACYHGAMTKKECEDLLGKKNKDGAYLIRDSETIQGAMCLCVYKQKVVYTYRLLQSHNGYYTLLTAGGLDETFFKTIDDLIRHYKRKNQGLAMHLRHSVKRKTALLIQPQRELQAQPSKSPEQRPRRTEREPWRQPDTVPEEEHDYENAPESEYVEVLPD
uniref:SH2 domain-containing protein n=1 Tax=Astatotilapia calliptera TaxID=8154 RepID=A0AAX7U099_ASTCA